MKENVSRNKMGVEPIPKLLLGMGIPMILSMAFQAFYNIVDSYFVSCMKDTPQISHMGDYGVNALTLAFPIQMLMVAVGVGTGVGVNAILSKSLGEGKREKASKIAGNSIFLGICTFLVYFLFSVFGISVYIRSQTSDPVIIKMGTDYLRICIMYSLGITLYVIYEKLLQATGRTVLTTVAQIAGALINIVLDPILIFGYFGFSEMGIKGAAYATVIGQFVSLILDVVFHYTCDKKDFDTAFHYMKPEGKIIKEIYMIGIPAILMQALMSFMTYGVNIIFGAVSTAAVTAYGVYYKVQQFVFFAAFGLNNAMIPIIGFNFGMRDKKRVHDGIKYGMIDTLVIMFIGAVGLQLFAHQLTEVFALSKETQDLCVMAIRVITLGYLFVGANIAYQGIFQALGCGIRSLIISLIRMIIVALPVAWIFSTFSNAQDIIWAAFPIAELAAFVVAFFLMKQIAREELKNI